MSRNRFNDTAIALTSAVAAFASGAVVANFGWVSLSLASLPIVAATALALLWLGSGSRANA